MTETTLDLDHLLDSLKRLAEQPLEQATALPREFYLSEAMLRHEEERIFNGQWLCAGRADAIPEPGDYLTCHIVRQPVTVMRQKNGEIAAFANVCRHRMMRLLDGSGHCERIVCPYHGWTYGIDGRLMGAPHMRDRPDFNPRDIALTPVRHETWQGWIYLTLDPDLPPPSHSLAPLEALVADYNMSGYVHAARKEYTWTGNWKQLVENFIEGYHLPVTHAATVGKYFDADNTRFADHPPDPAFTYQTFTKSQGTKIGRAHDDNTRLKDEWRETSYLFGVFPSHLCVLAPDHLWYLALQPKDAGCIHIQYGAAIAPEVLDASDDREALTREICDFLDVVNDEDKFVIEGLYQGVNAPLSTPGPLCWLEQQNHEFTRYLARQLCD